MKVLTTLVVGIFLLTGCEQPNEPTKSATTGDVSTPRQNEPDFPQAELNCKHVLASDCRFVKTSTGTWSLHIADHVNQKNDDLGLSYTDRHLVYADGSNSLTELWVGVFAYGLRVCEKTNQSEWGSCGGYPAKDIAGIDPKVIDSVLVKLYTVRNFPEIVDKYGHLKSPARNERKIIKEIILRPGNIQLFDWAGGHIDDKVWKTVEHEAHKSITSRSVSGSWETYHPLSHLEFYNGAHYDNL